MTSLHAEVVAPKPASRRRQLTRAFGVGAVVIGAAVGVAVPAQAAVPAGVYHVTGTAGAGSSVLSGPGSAGATVIATLADNTSVTIDCGDRGRSVHGNTVWHHITSPKSGYIADYYTDTPGFGRFLRGEATCAPGSTRPTPVAAPATPITSPVAARGATIDYNEGYGGSCVYYAMDRFHQRTGVYPKAFGDARYLASSAASNGWSVGTVPRVNSLAVFQPGQNGAGAVTGHAAWVEQVTGGRIYVAEMNAPEAWVVTYRWLTPAAGVQFIYTS